MDGELVDGRYRVLGTVGRGGMGEVLRVRDELEDRELALKRMREMDGVRREVAELRFRREFHTLAGFRHPHVVEAYDYGVDASGPYYTMELLDTRDVRAIVASDLRSAYSLLRDVASALAFLHARGFLHRDLSTRNVRCTADGRAKLIDFGLLSHAGASGEPAGTPPYMAPETLRGLPLDHRVDLFALGALAYYVLTGQHAFPVREFDDLEAAWRVSPPPPSTLRDAVPERLDDLVLSLLSLDPLARPPAAAAVIDQLVAIGGLEPVHENEIARGYLVSAALVGRRGELDRLRLRLRRALKGGGRAALIEAPSGGGKSRLLREVGLEAQLTGAMVVRTACESIGRGPYAAVRALTRALLATAEEVTIEAARPHASMLARVIPEVRARIEGAEPAAPVGDPAEDRILLQQALSAWLLALARMRPLVILVDDVQRCDEGSAAVLAALARSAPSHAVLLVLALRTDERESAPAAIAALRDASMRLPLAGFSPRDVEELVRVTLGDVPNAFGLARWMHGIAAGSPLHCVELLHHVVDGGIVRYAEGMWTVPDDVSSTRVPEALSDAMDARVRGLDPAARALGELLAVHGGELPLELCARLAETDDDAVLLDALDALCAARVLVAEGDRHRFRHDGLREALVRRAGPERRPRLHARVAGVLLEDGDPAPERQLEVGWHLFHGGRARAGADMLTRAGRHLYQSQSFRDAIDALEAALEVYEREGTSPVLDLEIRSMLLSCGTLCDRAVTYRHFDETVLRIRRHAGLPLIERVGRVLGRPMGLLVGVAWTSLRRLFVPRARRGPSPVAALTELFVVVSYGASVFSACFDLDRCRAALPLIEPIAFPKGRAAHGAYLLCENFVVLPLGRWAGVRANCEVLLHALASDRLTPMKEVDRRTGQGAAHYIHAILGALDHGPWLHDALSELEALGLRFFEVGADVARVLHHRMRGEEDNAREIEARVEVALAQLGSMWLLETQLRWYSAVAYALSRDVLGLKRTIESLARMVEAGQVPEAVLELSRGEYLRERGDIERARSAFERALSLIVPDDFLLAQWGLAGLAETCLAAGESERARELGRRGLELAEHPDGGRPPHRLRIGRVLALAEAALGDGDVAEHRLDGPIADAEALGSPALAGSVYEARARVALLRRDLVSFEHHAQRADAWLRQTRNPSLIMRAERLGEIGRSPRSSDGSPSQTATITEATLTIVDAASVRRFVSGALSECRGPEERAARVLELIVGQSGAAHGYLFLSRDGSVEQTAPRDTTAPAPVRALAEIALEEEDGEGDALVSVTRATLGPAEEAHIVVLRARPHHRSVAVGALVLVEGALPLRAPDAFLVEHVASKLYEAGDAVSVGRRSG